MLCPTRPCWTSSHCTPVLTLLFSLYSWTRSSLFCSTDTASMLQPQGLCTRCSLCWKNETTLPSFPQFENNINSNISLANARSWQLLSSMSSLDFLCPPTPVFSAALMSLLRYSRLLCPGISSAGSRVGLCHWPLSSLSSPEARQGRSMHV